METTVSLCKLGSRIKSMRETQKLSQIQLANKIGISLCEMYRIEKGKANFSILCLARLAKALDMNVVTLLNNIDFEDL